MPKRDIVIRIDRKGLVIVAALVLIGAGGAILWSETLTLVTTYPSPSGIYNQLVTTGNSGTVPANTTLNRNAGNTILVPPTNASGNVGIGTLAPASKLQVAGGVQLGDDTSACTAFKQGALKWIPWSSRRSTWGRGTVEIPGQLAVCTVDRGWVTVYPPPAQTSQTWQDVTAFRTQGVTYRNETTLPIHVQVSLTFNPMGVMSGGRLVVDGLIRDRGFGYQETVRTLSAVVPPGGTYSVSSERGGIVPILGGAWMELR